VIACVAAFWDISNRKRAAQNLFDSEERLRLLVESAVDYAIFTVDRQNRITSWNAGAERQLGWTESEAIGRSGAIIFTPEDRATGEVEMELQQATDRGRAVDERMHIRKDGSRFWASGILTALVHPNGAIRGYAKILRDNTERRESQRHLEAALRASEALRSAAESANRAKDEFISTVSHELRTPLNTIRLWSKMLGSGKVPHEDWAEGIRMVDRAAITQQQLIDDLLDVSRMASGKMRLSAHPNRLTVAIKGAVDAVLPMAASRGVELESSLSEDIGIVRADPDRIQQVVWNLLTNAIKFTPSRGRITVTALRDKEVVEIRVADTGIGIKPEFLPHVFDRFQQAEVVTTRTHGGLGLGLAIAKQLVELHGGSIEATSEGEGRGSVFTVRLPLRSLTAELETESSDAVHKQGPGLGGLRVLLVEDDPGTRQATRRLLALHGATVRVATTAAQAREAHGIERPEVIVCDIGLPGEDGYALIRDLRHVERETGAPRVPAIAVTAFAREEDQKSALDAGFDQHIAKPIDEEALLSTLASLVDKQ
jgi:PAS domain S-box-containing protein